MNEFNIGTKLSKQQKFSDAIIAFKKAVKVYPVESLLNIGYCYTNSGNFFEAFVTYNTGLALTSDVKFKNAISSIVLTCCKYPFYINKICDYYINVNNKEQLTSVISILFAFHESDSTNSTVIFEIIKKCCIYSYQKFVLDIPHEIPDPKIMLFIGKLYYLGNDFKNAVSVFSQIQPQDLTTRYFAIVSTLRLESVDIIPVIDELEKSVKESNLSKNEYDMYIQKIYDLRICYYNANDQANPVARQLNLTYNELKTGRAIVHEWSKNHLIDHTIPSNEIFGAFKEKETFVIKLTNVFVDEYAVYDSKNFFLGEKAFVKFSMQDIDYTKKIKKINTPILHFLYTNHGNYYHIVIESLARLAWFQKKYTDFYIFLPQNSPQYLKDYLNMLNFTNIIYIENGYRYLCSTVYILDYKATDENILDTFHLHSPSLEIIRNISSVMTENVEQSLEKIIYIKRKIIRTVNNDEILVDMLRRKFGEQFVVFEGGSVREQQALFSEAKLIVSPHGAGLTNMIFSKNTTVIEFSLEPNVNRCFEHIAAALGHRHYYFNDMTSYYYGNYTIDSDILCKLETFIDNVL